MRYVALILVFFILGESSHGTVLENCARLLEKLVNIPAADFRPNLATTAAFHATTVEALDEAVKSGGLLPSINFSRDAFPELKDSSLNVLFVADLKKVSFEDISHFRRGLMIPDPPEYERNWKNISRSLAIYAEVGAKAHAFLRALNLSIQKYHPIIMYISEFVNEGADPQVRIDYLPTDQELVEDFLLEIRSFSRRKIDAAVRRASERKGILISLSRSIVDSYPLVPDLANSWASALVTPRSNFPIHEWLNVYPLSSSDEQKIQALFKLRD